MPQGAYARFPTQRRPLGLTSIDATRRHPRLSSPGGEVTRKREPDVGRAIRALGARALAPADVLCSDGCLAALAHYHWDTLVSGAFQELLWSVERSVRVEMQRQLARQYQRADWWEAVRLHPRTMAKIENARNEVRGLGLPVTNPAVVAHLTFGFWAALLSRGDGYHYENQLWRPALFHAFPFYQGRRETLRQEIDSLRRLRNHISHPDGTAISTRNLKGAHDSIYRVMEWISPDTADWLRTIDRVPVVLAARPSPCAGVCIPSPRRGQ